MQGNDRMAPLCLLFLVALLPIIISIPIQFGNETLIPESDNNSTEGLIELIQRFTTIQPNTTTARIALSHLKLSEREWKRLTGHKPLVTDLAFDVGVVYKPPTYAYITEDSYNRYVEYLDAKCRKPHGDNIAEQKLDNLDYEYFQWEHYEFSKALMHKLFPETINGDHRRLLSANIVHHISLGTELTGQCLIVEHKDDWAYIVNEKVQFEDALINRIFQPRYFGEDVQAILDGIEDGELIDVLSFSTNSSRDRSKRGAAEKRRYKKSRKQIEQEARQRFREYVEKTKRRV